MSFTEEYRRQSVILARENEWTGRCANSPGPGRHGGVDVNDRTCLVESCTDPVKARGWCQVHYQRQYNTGRLERSSPKWGSREERFWSHVRSGAPGACWPWGLSTNRYGYGQVKFGKKNRLAHRVAYELAVGEIPDGLTLDHLCRNRACCNPSHLEPVPNRENVRRGVSVAAVNASKTRCIHGHPFDEANTYWYVSRGNDVRGCKECRRQAVRRYRS